jgi:anti-sigma regulatory factor (Ser/Thr protein kinase)
VSPAGPTYSEEFSAVPASVARARAAVASFAMAAGAIGPQLEAIRLAASEAITNVVRHAYRAPGGTFQVSASRLPGEVWLLVADDGEGMRPGGDGRGLGLGLAVIAHLADDFQIVKRASGGTELQMRFRLSLAQTVPPSPAREPQPAVF